VIRRIALLVLLSACAASPALAAAPKPGATPTGEWTYVQAMSIERARTITGEAHGTLRLSLTGVFSDERGIGSYLPFSKSGKYAFRGGTLVFEAYENGKRKPSADEVWSYRYDRKRLALSLVSEPGKDGSQLAFLLYFKGTENLTRCKSGELSLQLRC
jgi:hypothetical protein